jgi:hypothetical protein
VPSHEDSSPSRGWDSVYNDARLLADILGVHLELAERHDELADLQARFAP